MDEIGDDDDDNEDRVWMGSWGGGEDGMTAVWLGGGRGDGQNRSRFENDIY